MDDCGIADVLACDSSSHPGTSPLPPRLALASRPRRRDCLPSALHLAFTHSLVQLLPRSDVAAIVSARVLDLSAIKFDDTRTHLRRKVSVMRHEQHGSIKAPDGLL
eukprot:scaffold25882_cov25-Tisochrysis_lutea.AAC.2